jgi:uncharacterized protein (TIGR02466 family)
MNYVIDKWFPKLVYTTTDILPKNELEDLKNSCVDVVNVSGTDSQSTMTIQSTHTTNDHLENDPRFKSIKDFILTHIKNFCVELGYHSRVVETIDILNMWTNISGEGNFIFPHQHPNSLISGVFYVEAPKYSVITFYNEFDNFYLPMERNELTYSSCNYDCITNSLILFRSDLVHGNPLQPAGRKIAISFNTYFNNKG